MAKVKKPPRRLLDIRLILTDTPDEAALAKYVIDEARRNVRTLSSQAIFMMRFAAAQIGVERGPP